MYNETIIRFGFCDIQNKQGLGKGYLFFVKLILLLLCSEIVFIMEWDYLT